MLGEIWKHLETLQAQYLGKVHLTNNIGMTEPLMGPLALSNVTFLVATITRPDDEGSWDLDLAALPSSILFQLQDGLTGELHVREGGTLQTLRVQKFENK